MGGDPLRRKHPRWQGYDVDDTNEEPAQRFGTELPFELPKKCLTAHPSAIT